MAANKKKGALDYPLTPALLTELNAFDDCPFPEGAFNQEGNWTNYYRLWTSYGFYERNRDDGYVKISRQQRNPGNECQLSVEQVYINLASRKYKTPLKHKTGAVINCKNNNIASPLNWDLTSEFLDGPEDIKEFKRADSLRESVTVEGDELVITANNRTFRRKVSNKLTADWNLFNAVQLLPFDKNIDIKFDFLEGLRAFREKHHLYYKGKIRDKWGTNTVNFHCFEHLGNGVLPYEYWVTENHRLALVITGNRAYILKES